MLHTCLVTLIVVNFLALTFWAVWPPHLLFAVFFGLALVVFYSLVIHERRTIRRVLGRREDDGP